MKKLMEEIRLLICEWLESFIVSIAPKNKDGVRKVKWIYNDLGGTLDTQINEFEKQETCSHGSIRQFPFSGIDWITRKPKHWDVTVCNDCDKILEEKEITT